MNETNIYLKAQFFLFLKRIPNNCMKGVAKNPTLKTIIIMYLYYSISIEFSDWLAISTIQPTNTCDFNSMKMRKLIMNQAD